MSVTVRLMPCQERVQQIPPVMVIAPDFQDYRFLNYVIECWYPNCLINMVGMNLMLS